MVQTSLEMTLPGTRDQGISISPTALPKIPGGEEMEASSTIKCKSQGTREP